VLFNEFTGGGVYFFVVTVWAITYVLLWLVVFQEVFVEVFICKIFFAINLITPEDAFVEIDCHCLRVGCFLKGFLTIWAGTVGIFLSPASYAVKAKGL
jgi:hypothetical protein